MFKNLIAIAILAVIIVACNNTQTNSGGNEYANADTVMTPINITVADFIGKASEFAGKEVIITGTVSHTCKHGGKRMFIYSDNPDESVEVKAGESISAFDATLEGSEVKVTGLLAELIVDEAYLNEWENEVKLESGNNHEIHDGEHAGENADSAKLEKYAKINDYRKQIAESGKSHLSFYSIECKSYEVLPTSSEK
jgi:hypothetical protein